MPGSTPNIALPYPIPTDPLAAGADSVEDLATAIDSYLSVAAHITQLAGQTVTGGGGGEDMVWSPGISIYSSAFAFEPGDVLLEYTGPTRWFAYDLLVTWPGQASETDIRTAVLELNGATYATQSVGTDSGGNLFTQEIVSAGNARAGMIKLTSGDQVGVLVIHGAAGDRLAWAELRLKGL